MEVTVVILTILSVILLNFLIWLLIAHKKLEQRYYSKVMELIDYKEKTHRMRNIKVRVGSVFYFPNDHGFVEEVRNKRAKITRVNGDKCWSRLVDENNNPIEDREWHGSVDSTLEYIFIEDGKKEKTLKHDFYSGKLV